MSECCQIRAIEHLDPYRWEVFIDRCPLHQAAPEMLAALKQLDGVLDSWDGVENSYTDVSEFHDAMESVVDERKEVIDLKALIRLAEGKS